MILYPYSLIVLLLFSDFTIVPKYSQCVFKAVQYLDANYFNLIISISVATANVV